MQKICLLLSLGLAYSLPGVAQERWFQVEVTVFSNEAPGDRNAEVWSPEGMDLAYPARLRKLDSLLDLLFIPALLPSQNSAPGQSGAAPEEDAGGIMVAPEAPASEPDPREMRRQRILATGPFPAAPGEPFQLADFERRAFLQLPVAASQFQQTNRALERAPGHRVLYHGNWRQPVVNQDESQPIYIDGGFRFGAQSELQGSLGIYFNAARDRVVADADLWLSEFGVDEQASRLAGPGSMIEQTLDEVTALGAVAEPGPLEFPGPVSAPESPQWHLPPVPAGMRPPWLVTAPEPEAPVYRPTRIYRLHEAREMRSTEFHYLDHPALGVIVTVEPYELPPEPENEVSPAETDDPL